MTILEIVLIVLLVLCYFGFAFVIYTSPSKYSRLSVSYLMALWISLFIPFITIYWYTSIFIECAIKPLIKRGR